MDFSVWKLHSVSVILHSLRGEFEKIMAFDVYSNYNLALKTNTFFKGQGVIANSLRSE